jgi:hypothetical protein
MPDSSILLIDETLEGWFLVGYSEVGEFAGDTWHQSADEAKSQARFEHGSRLGEWRNFPDGVADPVAYALAERERD